MRQLDVLDLSAKEHRQLQRALREAITELRTGAIQATGRSVIDLASRLSRHEAMDRLLLYPLFGRDGYGRRSVIERRAEQRSISDQLLKALRVVEDGDHEQLRSVFEGIRLTFVGHSDREELEDFPHARRLSSPDERFELGRLRQSLREELAQRLSPITSASLVRNDGHPDRIGPIQIAIARAKEILVELDRSPVGVP